MNKSSILTHSIRQKNAYLPWHCHVQHLNFHGHWWLNKSGLRSCKTVFNIGFESRFDWAMNEHHSIFGDFITVLYFLSFSCPFYFLKISNKTFLMKQQTKYYGITEFTCSENKILHLSHLSQSSHGMWSLIHLHRRNSFQLTSAVSLCIHTYRCWHIGSLKELYSFWKQ